LKRRFIAICAAAVCVLLSVILAFTVFSDGQEKSKLYVSSEIVGASGRFNGIDVPEDAKLFSEFVKKIDNDEKSDGKVGIKPLRLSLPAVEGGTEAKYVTYFEKDYIVTGKVSGAESVKLTFDLSTYDVTVGDGVAGIGLYAQGAGNSDEKYSRIILKLTVTSGDDLYYTTLPVAANAPVIISFASEDHREKLNIDKLTMEAFSDGGFRLSSLRLTEPFVTGKHTVSFAEASGCQWMSVLDGDVHFNDDSMVLSTSKSGCAVAVGTDPYSKGGEDSTSTVRYVEIGAASGHGSIGVDITDASSDNGAFRNIDGEGKRAVVRLTGVVSRGNVLEFKSSTEEDLTVDRIRFETTKEKADMGYQPLTVLTAEDGILHGEGSLDSKTVKDHKRMDLGVFMVPAVGGEPVMIGETGVASRFSFDISLEDHPHAAADCMFYVAIVDSDGKIYRAGRPEFVSSVNTVSAARSPYAMYGVDPIAFYESGAPTVMVDVDIYELTKMQNSGSVTVARGGYVYGFNSKYISGLDSQMDFYMTSDVTVYLRLICSKEITSRIDGTLLTYKLSGDEVMLRSDTAEAANMYSAIVGFLCERYTGVRSIVLGRGVNSERLTGIPAADMYKYASDVAMAARLIYGAASEYSEVFVTLPMCAEDEESVSAEMFSALFSEKLMRLDPIPFAVMYTSEKCEYPVRMSNVENSLYLNGTPTVSFNVFCYEPEISDLALAENYTKLCEGSTKANVRTVFLSAERLGGVFSLEVLDSLKNDLMTDSSLFLDSGVTSMSGFDMTKIKGQAYMWDFTSAGSKLGWIAGYGISAMATAKETSLLDPSDTRVLRCVTESREGSKAGIMLCRLPVPLNLSDSPYLEFVYSFACESPVNTVFIFGNGENRAEFSVSADLLPDEDGKYRVVCDLSEFSLTSSVAYVGIIIYSEEKAVFDLTSVCAMSETLDSEGIENLITKLPEEEKEPLPVMKITIVAIVAVIFTVAAVRVLVVLRRYDSTLVNVVKKRRRY